MRLQDVLGDQVLRGGPEGPEILSVRITNRGHVVDQGVEPDIGHVVFVEWKRDPPSQTALRSGDAEILQGIPQERQGLVPIALRPDKVRVFLDVVNEPLLVFAHPEEVVALFAVFGNRLMLGAFPVGKFLLHVEPFATDAVEPLVLAEVNIPGLVDLQEDPPDRLHVVRIGRPDEAIVGHRQLRPEGTKLGADPVGVGLRGDARLLGRLGDLVAVLVGSRGKKGPEAAEAVVAGQDVGDDRRVGVPDMGRGVYIVDRRCDIKCFFHNSPYTIGVDMHKRIMA